MDTLNNVKSIAEAARKGSQQTKELCVLITLEVSNAFNSSLWEKILEEILKRKSPGYIINLISSYLSQRSIIISDATGATERVDVPSGVPQESILGPTKHPI